MEDDIVQKWDHGDISTTIPLIYYSKTKVASARLASSVVHLRRSHATTYVRILHLRKCDTERLRLKQVKTTKHNPKSHTKWNPITNDKWHPVTNPKTNVKWDPINNAKHHDNVMTWKVKQTLLDGHSSQTRV